MTALLLWHYISVFFSRDILNKECRETTQTLYLSFTPLGAQSKET